MRPRLRRSKSALRRQRLALLRQGRGASERGADVPRAAAGHEGDDHVLGHRGSQVRPPQAYLGEDPSIGNRRIVALSLLVLLSGMLERRRWPYLQVLRSEMSLGSAFHVA